jgi:hypothetical protein
MKPAISIFLMITLVCLPTSCGSRRLDVPTATLAAEVFESLNGTLNRPYLELFQIARDLELSSVEREEMSEYFEESEAYCVSRFEQRADEFDAELREVQEELRESTARISEDERHRLHCQIQNLRALLSQTVALRDQVVPIAYDNKQAKLRLIAEWPAELARIEEELESERYLDRRFGDVADIGFRDVGRNQQDDIAMGQDAIEELERAGLMPPEVDNTEIQTYVRSVAERVAAASDLQVPVRVAVLDSDEINAFALPGGFLFVQRGLLEAADDEAQLAGVIAHEIAHAAARHGRQLTRRATIADIIYQVAQVAAIVLTGGAVGALAYYALQYGFFGLGLVLSLDLLGVSRDFELEADQLGVQYAWNAGYDPEGFIRFFDKMATTEGYVEGTSWFRTHPPFYERMVASEREIMFLPAQEEAVIQTSEFIRIKESALPGVVAAAEEEAESRPSLEPHGVGCAPPEDLYEEGQPIETICTTQSLTD